MSHFIESFGFKTSAKNTPSPTWLDELALFLTLPTPSLAKHSIRAGSMFFYGSLTGDVSIQTEARKWYSKSLQDLQRLLSEEFIFYWCYDLCRRHAYPFRKPGWYLYGGVVPACSGRGDDA